MRRFLVLTLALALTGACQSNFFEDDSFENDGDRLFRRGNYLRALKVYTADAEDGDDSAELRAKIEETRYRVISEHARVLIHQGRFVEAIDVLDQAERMRPGHSMTANLRARAGLKLAEEYTKIGEQALEDEDPETAMSAFGEALVWKSDHEAALVGMGIAQQLADARVAKGERLFFKGLHELNDGHDQRAYASFVHATTLLGEGSRPSDLADQVRLVLADSSRLQGEQYLSAGLVGPAWVAFRDSLRLDPENPLAQKQVRDIEARIGAQDLLSSAAIGIRGGDLARAEEKLAMAGQVAGEQSDVADQITAMQTAVDVERNRQRYVLARALELDRQIVRASGLYREILEDSPEGQEDVFLRLQRNLERISSAEAAYGQAMTAIDAGDRETALQRLAETVRLARDYKDAAQQLRNLQVQG